MTRQEAQALVRKLEALTKHQDEPEGYYWFLAVEDPTTGHWRVEAQLSPH